MIQELIKPESVLCNAEARSKKHCLEMLSELLARADAAVAKEDIFAKLIERERLGCTSLLKGSAFPHCRVEGIQSASGALMTLATPVEFDSPDDAPVELVFGLMVPEEIDVAHYSIVEIVTACLTDEQIRVRLRKASSNKALYDAWLTECHNGPVGQKMARNA